MKFAVVLFWLLLFSVVVVPAWAAKGDQRRTKSSSKKKKKKNKKKKSEKQEEELGKFFTSASKGDKLLRINDDTGRVEKVGSFKPKRFKQRGGITSLEYDDSDETIYGIYSEKCLVVVDPDKATVTPIGTSLGGIKQVRGLAADHLGNLYAHSNAHPGRLLSINKKTGRAIILFNTFVTVIRDLAYHIQSGLIYATDGFAVITINPRDGTVEELDYVSGLSEDQMVEGIAALPTGEIRFVDNQKPLTLYALNDFAAAGGVEGTGKEKKNRVTGGTYVAKIEPVVCEGTVRRRSWRTTGCDARAKYLRAVEAIKKLPRDNALGIPNYEHFTQVHNASARPAHFNPRFLPWHRWYTWKFEQALQTISNDCSIYVPYWDWEENPDFPEQNPVWRADTFGSTTGLSTISQTDDRGFRNTFCVNEGIADFRGFWKTTYGPAPGACLQRALQPQPRFSIAGVIPVIAVMLNNETFKQFNPTYERRPHGAPHSYVEGHMASFYSPADPIFYPHHANVDRHWAIWQDYWGYDTIPFANLTEVDYADDARFPIDEPLEFVDNPGFFNYPGRSTPPTPRELHHMSKTTYRNAIVDTQYVDDLYAFRFAQVSDYRETNNPDWVEIAEGIPEPIECGGGDPLIPVGDTTDRLLPRRFNQLQRQNPGLTKAEVFVLLLQEYCDILGNPLFATPEWLRQNGFEGQEELFQCDSLT